ncbi:thiamine pyrophosphate-binding protein [Ornithinimicrobium avium]|uniref:Thiamine pyrophosphate-binding protein n=1 Tax=Ornithinimicrobium avium TaxID=2283195 RepID=A0A345NNQ6_9MICO|nr:thiamine pyrophosphate-binding protein [Ornithinimicrobium avium]AXH96664.1 thiamine pyrophosphate-binding protein [Ornithinimicrobium avium]
MNTDPTVADVVAEALVASGVRRVFGLCGGHIQELWDALVRRDVEIVDVRHEASAVYMAHAAAELTGELGVALVTAGPGLTNTTTAVSNAGVSRVPVLVLSGSTPRPQVGMSAMQDVAQAALMAPITRRAESVRHQRHVLDRLSATIRAAQGEGDEPGPAYLDLPTDLQTENYDGDLDRVAALVPYRLPPRPPAAHQVDAAAAAIRRSRRPLVIAGRAAIDASALLQEFLAATGAVYLDTGESRGALPQDHPAAVPAMRARAMREADLVIVLARRLDFQLAYGSPAVFSGASTFVRIGRYREELSANRVGDVEVCADVRSGLQALLDAGARPVAPDVAWQEEIVTENKERVSRLAERIATAPAGDDGAMHPYTLIGAVNELVDDTTVAVADGGDILSFSRVALQGQRYLDCGPLGCLGVGVPFATAAALTHPERRVVAVIGDGSFGFTAMDVDTAVRQGAKAVFVVANNEAWNIERYDQVERFDGRLVGVDLPGVRYDLLGQALGAHGERVESADELGPALRRALENAPAVVDVRVTRDAVSPDYLSGLAEVPPYQALRAWNDAESSSTVER